MASMMHEGPDGEHVTYRPDERTRPGRPWVEHCPPVRAVVGAPALWARRGYPQALTPPSEGPGWVEKGGRESSRSSSTLFMSTLSTSTQ